MEKMELNKWIDRISRLALIKISDDEREKLIKDLIRILRFFNEINELDLKDVEPLFHVIEKSGKVRRDNIGNVLKVDEALLNVKEKYQTFIKGPKTV